MSLMDLDALVASLKAELAEARANYPEAYNRGWDDARKDAATAIALEEAVLAWDDISMGTRAAREAWKVVTAAIAASRAARSKP